MGVRTKWTTADLAFIRERTRKGLTLREIAEEMGRTYDSVWDAASRNGIEVNLHRPKWSAEDTELLVEMYMAGSSSGEIAEILGVNSERVRDKVKALGLAKKRSETMGGAMDVGRMPHLMWTSEQENTLRGMYRQATSRQIAAAVGKPITAVNAKIHRLGLVAR